MTLSRTWFIEADFREGHDLAGSRNSPFSLIDHPFRVIVETHGFEMVLIGTVALGSIEDPFRYARDFTYYDRGWSHSLVLSRSGLNVVHTFIRPKDT